MSKIREQAAQTILAIIAMCVHEMLFLAGETESEAPTNRPGEGLLVVYIRTDYQSCIRDKRGKKKDKTEKNLSQPTKTIVKSRIRGRRSNVDRLPALHACKPADEPLLFCTRVFMRLKMGLGDGQ